MVVDILLYDIDYIPVDEGQRHDLKIARDIAKRFNSTYNKEIVECLISIRYIRAYSKKYNKLLLPENDEYTHNIFQRGSDISKK